MSTFFSASGNSPTERDPNPNPKVQPSRFRHEALFPLVEAITDAVGVGFKTLEPESPFPRVKCRECGVEGWVSILRADSFERIVHEPNCRFGTMLRQSVRIATYAKPSKSQVESISASLKNIYHGFLYRIAKEEQALEVAAPAAELQAEVAR